MTFSDDCCPHVPVLVNDKYTYNIMRFKINISSINYDLGELVFGLFAQFGSEKRTNKVV